MANIFLFRDILGKKEINPVKASIKCYLDAVDDNPDNLTLLFRIGTVSPLEMRTGELLPIPTLTGIRRHGQLYAKDETGDFVHIENQTTICSQFRKFHGLNICAALRLVIENDWLSMVQKITFDRYQGRIHFQNGDELFFSNGLQNKTEWLPAPVVISSTEIDLLSLI